MPRPSKPWFWRTRGRWAVTIDGKRHVAPAHIALDDMLGMALWWEGLQAGTAPVSVGSTVAEVCEAYGAWDALRVAAGQRSADGHRTCSSNLTRVCAARLGHRRFGEMPAAQVRAGHLDALIRTWLGDGRAVPYVRLLADHLKIVFAWAAREVDGRSAILARNPLERFRLPTVPESKPRFADAPEAAQWLRWLKKQDDVPKDFILLQRCLINTGARPSEWTRATVADLAPDLLTRTDWKAARKTGRVRRIFVPIRLQRTLRRHARGLDPGAILFASSRGQPWQADGLSAATKRYRRRAIADGCTLIRDEGPDRLTCYRWRHTAITRLIMAGVPVSTIAELTGTSVGMIERNYKHLLSSHLARAAEALARRH